jgi:hypothetical protein
MSQCLQERESFISLYWRENQALKNGIQAGSVLRRGILYYMGSLFNSPGKLTTLWNYPMPVKIVVANENSGNSICGAQAKVMISMV